MTFKWLKQYICCCKDTNGETEIHLENITDSFSPIVETEPANAAHHPEIITDEDNLELNTFLEFVFAKIQLKREGEEILDIHQSVEKTVSHLLNKLANVKPLLKCEIVHTGSCYDGTKILEPDEFDFLAIIDCLSVDDAVFATLSRNCTSEGFAHAILKDRTNKWSYITQEHAVVACRKSTSLREMFRKHFHLVLQDAMSQPFRLEMDTGSLVLDGFAVAINGPQCSVRVQWLPNNVTSEKLQIDIDITPAIKCCDITSILNSTDVVHSKVYELMKADPVFYLIPRPDPTCNYCFKIVFTKVDQKLIKTLDQSHIKELMILKYISREILKCNFRMKSIFSSFALKMAVFHHSLNCNGTNANVGECLISTLNQIIERLNLDPPGLPSVFIIARNVWKHQLDAQELSLARETLESVTELFKSIRDGKLKSFDFDNLRQMLINSCTISLQQE